MYGSTGTEERRATRIPDLPGQRLAGHKSHDTTTTTSDLRTPDLPGQRLAGHKSHDTTTTSDERPTADDGRPTDSGLAGAMIR